MYSTFYLILNDVTLNRNQLLGATGVSPDSPVEVLNLANIAPVGDFPPPVGTIYDVVLSSYDLITEADGVVAYPVYSSVPKPLADAKVVASQIEENKYNSAAGTLVSDSGVDLDIWTGAASQLEVDRPAFYATLLDEMTVIGDNLVVTLAAIDAATTVDEINNIVYPPTGILSTGRGGDGDGPLDLNNSFYTEFNSVSMTEAETELYIPGTSTVITYGAVVPNGFTSNGDCFVLGDYQVQIREVATGMVISEFECPLAVAANVDVPF